MNEQISKEDIFCSRVEDEVAAHQHAEYHPLQPGSVLNHIVVQVFVPEHNVINKIVGHRRFLLSTEKTSLRSFAATPTSPVAVPAKLRCACISFSH
jgi:hypothetical protein